MHNYLQLLKDEFKLHPVLAMELEFYVADNLNEETILETLNEICKNCLPAEKERGDKQYEIATKTFDDASEFVTFATNLRETITSHLDADFSAKPHANNYGSALHFHLHLADENGINIFTRSEDGTYSTPLLHTLGGLLETMPNNLKTFSPNDTERFVKHGQNSPTHICWGPNNRSCALRLPDKPLDNKHIEHRVSSADADIAKCIEALLEGTVLGLQNKLNPGEPIYGNAWDAQYGLNRIIELD